MNKFIYILVVVAILVGGFFALNSFVYQEKQGDTIGQPSYKDIAYMINEQSVQLIDGVAETEAAPGSVSKINFLLILFFSFLL